MIPHLRHSLPIVVALLLLQPPSPSAASFYQAGDIVEDFSLVHRDTREPVRLSELAGRIVFLEWFAWWCPFCQAAAPQVAQGIVDWYASRGGNPNGIPVLHVAVNLQPGQETQTRNFLQRAGFDFVLEDFNRALANRFQIGGQPIFAIINGLTNSPSHAPWQLLLHQDGYGQRDFSESIAEFRSVIDAVQSPVTLSLPALAADGSVRLTLLHTAGRALVLESSPDLISWTAAVELAQPTDPAEVVLPPPASSSPSIYFRVRISTPP